MTITPTARPLSSAINSATGRPWICITSEAHECAADGLATCVVGAYPCCDNGAVAEITAQVREQERRRRWEAENADLLRREALAEQAWERRANR